MSPIKMPTECGRYEWDGESVAVYWSNGELLADNGCVCETVDEFDGLCRIDGDGPEAPWSKVGVCCDDECDGDCHMVLDSDDTAETPAQEGGAA